MVVPIIGLSIDYYIVFNNIDSVPPLFGIVLMMADGIIYIITLIIVPKICKSHNSETEPLI